ncbi:TPA: hypothetical protein QCQ09_002561 [Bacillus cereus]|nr:hypothetical protein [Bacillus cereus]
MNFENQAQPIRNDGKGHYIVPYVVMDTLFEYIDELFEKAGLNFAKWCCYARPETQPDGVCGKRGYREASQEIATIKCQIWVANTHPSCHHDLRRGECPED